MLIKQWEYRMDDIYDIYRDLISDLVEELPHLSYNPTSVMHFDFAHIVWEDGNFESNHIEWCINEGIGSDMHIRFKKLLTRSLKQLLFLPKYEECEDYGNE